MPLSSPPATAAGIEAVRRTDSVTDTVFSEGDVVKVRQEDELSIVVLPTDRAPECVPEDVPDVGICCVPIALIRTPIEDGVLRWVELRDLTRVETPVERTSEED